METIILKSGQTETYSLVDTVTGKDPIQSTEVQLHHANHTLHIRFICTDNRIVSTYENRDDPLFEEEAVEVFIAPGSSDPKTYFEFEVSPNGTLWDGVVLSPNLSRQDMVSDPSWDSQFIQWGASIHYDKDLWEGWFSIDLNELIGEFDSIADLSQQDREGIHWRFNLYRIDRGEQQDEFTALNPTLAQPADFHVPTRMLHLQLIP